MTWFVYDLIKMLPDVIAEYDGNGALVAGYMHGPGIDDIVSMRRGSSYYYFKDGLGTVTSLADNTEGMINTYKYDSFGNVVSKTESVTNPYGFTGRVLDNESGLMYYRTRYYDANVGRFINEDPIGLLGGINLYGYCLNDPVNGIDPSGQSWCTFNCKFLYFMDSLRCHEQYIRADVICREGVGGRVTPEVFRRARNTFETCELLAKQNYDECMEKCEEECPE